MHTPCSDIQHDIKCGTSATDVSQNKNDLQNVLYNEALVDLYNDIADDLNYDLPDHFIQSGTTDDLHYMPDNLCNEILCGQEKCNQVLFNEELASSDISSTSSKKSKSWRTFDDLKKTDELCVTYGKKRN